MEWMLKLCLHHAGRYLSCAPAPVGTEAIYRNQSSLNKVFVLREHMRDAD